MRGSCGHSHQHLLTQLLPWQPLSSQPLRPSQTLTHLVSEGQQLSLQVAVLLSRLLQLSFLTGQLLLQTQELLGDKETKR